jgi:hypothetical protein
LLAKIATIASFLTDKSSKVNSDGESYYLAGAIELVTLLESGALVESEGRYVIKDAEKGVRALADLGGYVLQRFYVDKTSTPKRVAEYFKELRKLKKDPRVERFIAALRS